MQSKCLCGLSLLKYWKMVYNGIKIEDFIIHKDKKGKREGEAVCPNVFVCQN